MKGSLIVVGFFVLGVCQGRLDLAPALLMDSRVTFAALCCLLFCVGMSIGSNDNIVSEFRSLNPRLALLPVATILGSFAGSLVAWLFLQLVLGNGSSCNTEASPTVWRWEAALPIIPYPVSSLPNIVGRNWGRWLSWRISIGRYSPS
ncbi:putative membrane protein [Prevotella sp. CAG:732]|nr:putative membrane protein [Prevotella sp. CAG:732]